MEGKSGSKGKGVCRAEPMLGWVLERADQRSAPTEGKESAPAEGEEQSSLARLYKGQPTVMVGAQIGGPRGPAESEPTP